MRACFGLTVALRPHYDPADLPFRQASAHCFYSAFKADLGDEYNRISQRQSRALIATSLVVTRTLHSASIHLPAAAGVAARAIRIVSRAINLATMGSATRQTYR